MSVRYLPNWSLFRILFPLVRFRFFFNENGHVPNRCCIREMKESNHRTPTLAFFSNLKVRYFFTLIQSSRHSVGNLEVTIYRLALPIVLFAWKQSFAVVNCVILVLLLGPLRQPIVKACKWFSRPAEWVKLTRTWQKSSIPSKTKSNIPLMLT